MEHHDNRRRRQAQAAAEACARMLKEQFGAREVYIFGSLTGQSRSDTDLAVEGLAPERYIAALSALWQLLPDGMELDRIAQAGNLRRSYFRGVLHGLAGHIGKMNRACRGSWRSLRPCGDFPGSDS